MSEHDREWPAQSPLSVGFRGACPRCGEGRLYEGLLTPAKSCRVCGLDYSFIDSGDGPAVFVILILGFVVLGLAMLVETAVSPPLWLHAVIWFPVVAILSVWSLRFAKALLIALQYRTAAREGQRHI
jgi:uncharacterized protein (DUF983 family)